MPNYQAICRQRHASQRWQRHSGYAFAAVLVSYCQLLSMQHLPVLGQLAQARAKAAAAPAALPPGDLDLEFLNRGDTISFGNLF